MSSTAPVAAPIAYGGFWIRLLAIILDGIIIAVVTGALAPILGVDSLIPPTPPPTDPPPGISINFQFNALGTLFGLVYFVGFWAWRGQTPGMIPFRMRIVRAADGSRPDWVIALLRYVGLIISIVVFLLGVIWAAFDGRKQGWHDKIAGTLVVRDPA